MACGRLFSSGGATAGAKRAHDKLAVLHLFNLPLPAPRNVYSSHEKEVACLPFTLAIWTA